MSAMLLLKLIVEIVTNRCAGFIAISSLMKLQNLSSIFVQLVTLHGGS